MLMPAVKKNADSPFRRRTATPPTLVRTSSGGIGSALARLRLCDRHTRRLDVSDVPPELGRRVEVFALQLGAQRLLHGLRQPEVATPAKSVLERARAEPEPELTACVLHLVRVDDVGSEAVGLAVLRRRTVVAPLDLREAVLELLELLCRRAPDALVDQRALALPLEVRD